MRLRFLAAVVSASVIMAPAQAAQAAPAGVGYDNTDPSQTGCAATAITIWSKNLRHPVTGVVNGSMEVRYSTSCQTNWVRVNNLVRGATARKLIIRQRVNAPTGGSLEYAQDNTSDTFYGVSYGMQLYAPSWVCIQVGGFITLNNQVIASNGQTPDLVC